MVPSNGLTGIEDRVFSVLVVAVVFLAASGLALVALITFGVRAGLMAAKATGGMPQASSRELGLFLGSAFVGLAAVLLMVFMGLAENDLDNPLFLPLMVVFIGLGGALFLVGAGLAVRTIRRVGRHA